MTTELSASAPAPLPLRDEIEALLIYEENDYAKGWNAALREARDLVDRHLINIGDGTAAALTELRAEGKKTGGHMPYGYRTDRDGTLRELPAEQKVITAAKKLHARGLSLRAITRTLNERFEPRVGAKCFYPSQVRRMILGLEATKKPRKRRSSSPDQQPDPRVTVRPAR